MTRTIDASTLAQVVGDIIYAAWLIRLDVASDPVYIHTGVGNLTFGGGAGYDSALVGLTFTGVGLIGQIDAITDSTDGSQAVNLILPGIDLTLDYLHQFVTNADLWQRRNAYIWLATLDSSGALVGKPIRIKKGRMDQIIMEIDPSNNTGTLTVSIESQQAYSGEALQSKYIEQKQIDSTDTSQDMAASIANAVPGANKTTSASGDLTPVNPDYAGWGGF